MREEFGRARTEWEHHVETVSRVRELTEPAAPEEEGGGDTVPPSVGSAE